MPTYRDEGVVLRTHKLGEADRILTVLTSTNGKVRAVARGVRRTSSKFGGRLEPFSHVDLQFAMGKNLDVVTEAVTIHSYPEQLGSDYPRYTAGQVVLEMADRLVAEEKQPSRRQYALLVGALHALAHGTVDGPRPASLIMDSYLLRALSTAGLAPSLDRCASCGAEGTHDWFSPSAGGLMCGRCRPAGTPRVAPQTMALLTSLLVGDWPATRRIPDGTRQEASDLVSAFAVWHTEHGLRTLAHVDRQPG